MEDSNMKFNTDYQYRASDIRWGLWAPVITDTILVFDQLYSL